ncbi:hypothetical protein U6L91_12185, partial [Cutibacterium acnes]
AAPCPVCGTELTPHPIDRMVNAVFWGVAIGLTIVSLFEVRGLAAAAMTGVLWLVLKPARRWVNSFFRLSVYKDGRIFF